MVVYACNSTLWRLRQGDQELKTSQATFSDPVSLNKMDEFHTYVNIQIPVKSCESQITGKVARLTSYTVPSGLLPKDFRTNLQGCKLHSLLTVTESCHSPSCHWDKWVKLSGGLLKTVERKKTTQKESLKVLHWDVLCTETWESDPSRGRSVYGS